jgi:hypothetical protein
MANKVLAGYVTLICDIYIDDVLLFGATDNEYLNNSRKVLVRLREKKVTANPAKTRLGLKEYITLLQASAIIKSTGYFILHLCVVSSEIDSLIYII